MPAPGQQQQQFYQYPCQDVYAQPAQVQPIYNVQDQQQQQPQQQQQQFYQYQWPAQGFEVAPGGPLACMDYYQPQYAPQANFQAEQQQTAQTFPVAFDQNAPTQSYAAAFDNQLPALPPGAKLVAEYFIGYLDEQQQPIQHSQSSGQIFQQAQQQQQQQVSPVNQMQQTVNYQMAAVQPNYQQFVSPPQQQTINCIPQNYYQAQQQPQTAYQTTYQTSYQPQVQPTQQEYSSFERYLYQSSDFYKIKSLIIVLI